MKFILFLILSVAITSCGCNREKGQSDSNEYEVSVVDSDETSDSEEKACLAEGESASIRGVPGDDGWQLKEKCCEGLVDREAIEVCGKGIAGGYIYVCVACGDGECQNNFENKCNCPEDCKGSK